MFYKCKDGTIINLHQITFINPNKTFENIIINTEGYTISCTHDLKKIQELVLENK